ncbi:reverse transcriptase domain-containing protein [Tanacetum coccineum]
MTNRREPTPPSCFSTPPQIPNINTSERPHVTTTGFATTTPENTPFAYRDYTSANPNPMISPAFVEANYEVLESLLRERQRHIRNEDLRTELEYFSEDYDEKREMEPRPEPTREATPPLRLRSPGVRRQRERVVGFEEVPNREGSRAGRNAKGSSPSEIEARENGNREMNFPLLLTAHLGRNKRGQPLQSSLTSIYRGHQPSTNMGGISLLTAQNGNPFAGGTSAHHPQGGIYRRLSRIMAYLHIMGLCSFADLTGSVTPFVRWIDDYPLPDGLKIPSHIGSYDGKGDPDNFLHLFERAIRMQKWLMPVACHMFTYTLKDYTRICQQKKFIKTHLAVHNIKQREGESTRAFITRYTDDPLQILGLHKYQRISGFCHGLQTKSLVEHLSTSLPFTYKGLMEKTYMWVEAREVATNGALNDRRENFERSKKSFRDNNNGQKSKDRRMEEKGKGATPFEALVLMISRKGHNPRKIPVEGDYYEVGEIMFPPLRNMSSANPVIIKVYVSGREINRVYLDSGSSYKVIYEHCFLKLKPSIQSLRVDSKIPLVGFSEEQSWPLGEVPLEITIGEGPLTVTKTLNFVIVRSDSPHNLLLGRTAMQQIGIIVSTIHRAIQFHTPRGTGTVLSQYNPHRLEEKQRITSEENQEDAKDILSCVDAEERIVVSDQYPE